MNVARRLVKILADDFVGASKLVAPEGHGQLLGALALAALMVYGYWYNELFASGWCWTDATGHLLCN